MLGAQTQGANPQTYSYVNCFIGTDGCLYSNGTKVLTSYTEQYTGTVTSIGMTVPTGFSVTPATITTNGTFAISFANGYSLPTTVKQTNWDTAYGWGNHADAGYLTGITATMVCNALGFTISGVAGTTYNLATIESNATSGKSAYDLLAQMFTLEGAGTAASPYIIKANYGLYTEQFLSALGLNSSGSSGGATALSDLTDVEYNGTPSDGQVLKYSNGKWRNGNDLNIGTVTAIKLGTTGISYSPTDGVVTLPAYPTTLPASDVYSWAKASTKPSYTLDEVSDGSTRKLANYLPLSGGTITGTIYRAYTSSNQTPLIWMNGYDYDNYIWQVSSGTTASQYYGFGLKYLGTGSRNDNKLVLYADNQNGTDVAAYSITQDGVITFGETPKVGTYTVITSNNWSTYIGTSTSPVAYAGSANYATSAGSATALTNARLLWGNSFDGTADINNDIKLLNNKSIRFARYMTTTPADSDYWNVLTLNASNQLALGYYNRTHNAETSIQGGTITLNVNGGQGNATSAVDNAVQAISILSDGQVYLPQGDKGLRIGNGLLVWDRDNNAIKVVSYDGSSAANFYATGAVSALGANTSGSGGGGSSTLAGLTDVSVGSQTQGQVLGWDGQSYWVPMNMPSTSNFVTLNSTQTITGQKTFSAALTSIGGITLSDGAGLQINETISNVNKSLILSADSIGFFGGNGLILSVNSNGRFNDGTGVFAYTSEIPTSLDNVPDGTTRKLSNYLPLSGGTLNGKLTLSASTYKQNLDIYRSDGANNPVITFANVTDGYLGCIGFAGSAQTGMGKMPYVEVDGTMRILIHAGNIGSQSVAYATSAGSATYATSATKATNDGDGNTISSTYLKLTGGTLCNGTKDTPLYIKGNADGAYICFNNSSGTVLGYFGVRTDNKPYFYSGGRKELALKADIPTNNNQLTNGAGYITSSALSSYLPLTGGTLSGSLTVGDTQYTRIQSDRIKFGIVSSGQEVMGLSLQMYSNTADTENAGKRLNVGSEIIAYLSDIPSGGGAVDSVCGYTGDVTAADIGSALQGEGYELTDSNTARLRVGNVNNKTICTTENTDATIQFAGGTDGFTVTDGRKTFTVPVTTTGTTYSQGTGISISGTTISMSSTYRTYCSNGNTAYGWGNHANAGYLKGMSYIYFGDVYSNPYIQFTYHGEAYYVQVNEGSIGIGYRWPKSLQITTNGDASAISWTNRSDIRKKNVISYGVEPTVESVSAAPAIRFRWNDSAPSDRERLGTIAQYWKTVTPECVIADGEGYLSMQYDVIALLAAISIAKKVVNHEERIAELERENIALRNEINNLKAA